MAKSTSPAFTAKEFMAYKGYQCIVPHTTNLLLATTHKAPSKELNIFNVIVLESTHKQNMVPSH